MESCKITIGRYTVSNHPYKNKIYIGEVPIVGDQEPRQITVTCADEAKNLAAAIIAHAKMMHDADSPEARAEEALTQQGDPNGE